MPQFTVAIVGRANVGKSTLFNRILERPKAIVSTIAGTTRDRNYGQARWRGRDFQIVDTGGLEEVNAISGGIKKHVDIAVKKADAVIFLVDLKIGLMPQDRAVANFLQKLKKPVILVGNKADSPGVFAAAENPEWLKLSFGKPLPVSAANGAGTGDLLDRVFEFFKNKPDEEKSKDFLAVPPIKVAIVGKPNVGKSSLLNALLGEERVLVSEIPFTTREPQDMILIYRDQPFLLIDTVGMRKKARVEPGLEKVGVRRSIVAMDRADVILFITEAQEQMTSQEKHLSELILEKNAGLIIVANKWDLVEKQGPETMNLFVDYYNRFFPYLDWAPVIFVSAKTGEKVQKILDLVIEIKKNREKFIKAEELNKFLKEVLSKHWAIIHRRKKSGAGARPKLIKLVQEGINPPKFHLVTTSKAELPEGFIKFIEKKFRERFDFTGTPIKLGVRHIKKNKE
ncbi:ribosome biogenesis GTPase Der [Candidatus Falkowbacteria bacterium]|nr:ribosome biogenesis GTPase Der [Candidatus Falkowbacteria bacterium]